MKDLIKQFNLYGKITEQHAKDIEEILENYDKKVRKETAEYVCDKMIGKMKNEENDRWCIAYDYRIAEERGIAKQILKELL